MDNSADKGGIVKNKRINISRFDTLLKVRRSLTEMSHPSLRNAPYTMQHDVNSLLLFMHRTYPLFRFMVTCMSAS